MTDSTFQSPFIGLHLRANNIVRWPLMHCTRQDLLSSHIMECATIAHVIGAIARDVYKQDIEPDRVAVLALFHEAAELLGGDVSSKVKYKSPKVTKMFKELEREFEEQVHDTLPEALKPRYKSLIKQDKTDPHTLLAKAADVICAWIKCKYELSKSNAEFAVAMQEMEVQLSKYQEIPAVKYFCDTFLDKAVVTFDEQSDSMDWIKNATQEHVG